MKRYLFLSGFLLLMVLFSFGQAQPYNVVFDLTSKDSVDQRALMRWLNGISKDRPDAKLEVVMYGQSLNMVTQGNSVVAEDIKNLSANKNVSFKVCEIAMKRHNLTKDQLLPGVGTVPDGIYEIITKEGEGYGYIKVGH